MASQLKHELRALAAKKPPKPKKGGSKLPIVRTARGTPATDKTGALTLTVSGVLIVPDARIVVGTGYDSGAGAPVITWDGNTLEDDITNASGGVVSKLSSFYKKGGVNRTADVVATWTTTAPTSKEMWVEQFTNANGVDAGSASGAGGTSTSPASGAKTIDFFNSVSVGNIVTEGPPTDTVGTVSGGWTSGQRAGTSGAPPVSNTTSHGIFSINEVVGSVEAAKTGITSRDWSATMMTYRVAGHPEGVDTGSLQEYFRDLLAAVPLMEAYGFTIHLEDGVSLDVTDWTNLFLRVEPPP